MAKKIHNKNQPVDTNEEKTWFSWSGPIRPFKRQDTQFWTTCLAILGLVGVIFFFAKDFLIIIPAASALFLYYIMSTVPPEIVENKITNRGVYFGNNFYPWEVIQYFSFGKSMESRVLILGIDINFFTKQISIIINPAEEDPIKTFCLKRLPLVDTPQRPIDKLNHRLSKLLPFEDKKDTKSTL